MKCAVSSCRPTSSSVASPRPHLHFVQVCQEGLEGHELGLGNAALRIKGRLGTSENVHLTTVLTVTPFNAWARSTYLEVSPWRAAGSW